MGLIIAQSIIDDSGVELADPNNVTWPEADLLGYLNDGMRAVVYINPEAGEATSVITLVEGTKQSVGNAFGLNKILRNMGTGGSTPGRAITETSMDMMDRVKPNWHAGVTASAVVHYMYNKQNPLVFYVYPPQPASGFGQIEASLYQTPTDIAIGAAITIDDNYANALRNYVCFRAHAKEDEKAEEGKASAYLGMFNKELGANYALDDVKNSNRVEKKAKR